MSMMNISGLVSGLDTASLVDQLMQLERQPQQNLVSRKSAIQSTVDVYRTLNTKFAAVRSAAEALSTPFGWRTATATSTNTAVADVTASSSASPSVVTFTVNRLSSGHAVLSPELTIDPAAAGTLSGPISITANGATTTVTDVGDGSLNAVAAAISGSGAPVTATVVSLANGRVALQIASRTTGSASVFTVSGLDAIGGTSVLTQGADASVTVGDPNGVHYDVASSTNSFANLVAGTTITVKSAGSATVTVSTDAEALAAKVQALVTAVNDANSYIASQSGYNAATKTAGRLLGDLTASTLSRSLVDAVINRSGSLGISIDRSGVITFDKGKFLTAYQADPTQVAAAFQVNTTDPTQNGLAERLRLVGVNATDVVSGSITSAISSRTAEMRSLDDAIASWDQRLALRQQTLKAQFTAMETALSTLKNQSNWLAGQIASLPNMNAGQG